jgi:hypothetical protein
VLYGSGSKFVLASFAARNYLKCYPAGAQKRAIVTVT